MDPKPATSSQFSSLFRQARCRTGDQLSDGVIGDPYDDGNEDDDIILCPRTWIWCGGWEVFVFCQSQESVIKSQNSKIKIIIIWELQHQFKSTHDNLCLWFNTNFLNICQLVIDKKLPITRTNHWQIKVRSFRPSDSKWLLSLLLCRMGGG